MKKPIFSAATDIHLEHSNIEQRKGLFEQIVEIIKPKGINTLFLLGDIFESRKAIPENVLNSFGDILSYLNFAGIETVAIPGNHDKLVYTKRESYLTPFEHYPGFTLYQDNGLIDLGGVSIFLSPFYDEDLWVDKFKSYFNENKIDPSSKNILLSHIAVTGSKNNNGEEVDNGISRKMFKDFGKVFLGHYHNTHKVGENIIHIPSICQKNFGEDNNKGLTIVYDDLSYEVIKLNFREYINIDIDLSITTKRQIDKIVKDNISRDGKPFIKVKFLGTEAELKSIDKDSLNRAGVKVQTKIKEIEDSIEYSMSEEIKEYDMKSLLEAFEEFCDQEKISFEQGVKFFKSVDNG